MYQFTPYCDTNDNKIKTHDFLRRQLNFPTGIFRFKVSYYPSVSCFSQITQNKTCRAKPVPEYKSWLIVVSKRCNNASIHRLNLKICEEKQVRVILIEVVTKPWKKGSTYQKSDHSTARSDRFHHKKVFACAKCAAASLLQCKDKLIDNTSYTFL